MKKAPVVVVNHSIFDYTLNKIFLILLSNICVKLCKTDNTLINLNAEETPDFLSIFVILTVINSFF